MAVGSSITEEQMLKILIAAWQSCDSLRAIFNGLDIKMISMDTSFYEKESPLESLELEDYILWSLELAETLKKLHIHGINEPCTAFEQNADTIGEVVRNLLAMNPIYKQGGKEV